MSLRPARSPGSNSNASRLPSPSSNPRSYPLGPLVNVCGFPRSGGGSGSLAFLNEPAAADSAVRGSQRETRHAQDQDHSRTDRHGAAHTERQRKGLNPAEGHRAGQRGHGGRGGGGAGAGGPV